MNLRPLVAQPSPAPAVDEAEAVGKVLGPSPIARRVIAHRLRRGRTQIDLALAAGWSERSLRRLERGELPWVSAIEQGAPPTARQLRQLRALAQELRMELDDLLRPADVVPMAALVPLVDEAAPVAVEMAALATTPALPAAEEPRVEHAAAWPRLVLRFAPGRVVGAVLAGALPSLLARTTMPRLAGLASAAATVGAAAVVGGTQLHGTPPSTESQHPAPPITARLAPSAPTSAPRVGPIAPPPTGTAAAPPPSPITAAIPDLVGPAAPRTVGTVVPAVHVSRHVVGPVASLSTSAVDFGWVAVGSSVSRTVTLTNAGDAPLHVSQTTLLWADAVSAAQDTCARRTLDPGQRCSVTLVYHPTKSGMLAPFPLSAVRQNRPGVVRSKPAT